MLNPNNPIVTAEDYINIIGLPTEQQQKEEALNRLTKWLNQATDQIDSLISSEDDFNKLYRWYENLSHNNDTDIRKMYKIKKAICGWVETFILNGKIWTDNVPTINSNIDIDISASSDNADIEAKRKDIIQDLVTLGLYKVTNISGNHNNYHIPLDQTTIDIIQNAVMVNMRELRHEFVRREPAKPMMGNLDWASNDQINGGNIHGTILGNSKYKIKHYAFEDCYFDGNKNVFENITVNTSINSSKIWDPIDQTFKFINQFPISYWGGLTAEETINIAYAAGVTWRKDFIYQKNWLTQIITPTNEIRWFISLQDNNLNNEPSANPNWWEEVTTQLIDVNMIIDQLKPYLDQIMSTRLDQELAKRKHMFKQESQNQVIPFKDQADYQRYRDANNLLDSDFEDIPDPFNADFAIKSRDNVFSANNTFQRPLNIVEAQNNNQAVTKAYADQIRAIANSKQDRMSAGAGINLVGNRIDNVLWGRKIAIEEKLTLVFEAQDRINNNNSSSRTWNWRPETHMAGYLFVFILKNRDQGKPDTGYQFRQTFWNNLSYKNIIQMPINDGSDTGSNAGVWQEDFLNFQLDGGEIRQLKGNWSIFLGTLHIRIYKITYEATLN